MVRFQDKLQINFLESQARLIPVEAYGFGTAIVTSPTVSAEWYIVDTGSYELTTVVRQLSKMNLDRKTENKRKMN